MSQKISINEAGPRARIILEYANKRLIKAAV
jgi:hypothetical protein